MIQPFCSSFPLSIRKQCKLIDLSVSTYYYKNTPEDPLNLELTKIIDKQYMITPFYGVRRMVQYINTFLKKDSHHHSNIGSVNHKRIANLMKQMGIEGIHPKRKKNLSLPNIEHKVYPYLLKDINVNHPNHVWSIDITYIPMRKGFAYLVAIVDWYSRYILSWNISITLEVDFCIEALQKALQKHKPVIFNSDQGSQFTSSQFIKCLTDQNILISMDGKGRAYDNIFIERFWRTIKYEEIYLNAYENVNEAERRIGDYINFYNHERPHSSLGYQTPSMLYLKENKLISC
jgi:putative transposase